MGKTSNPLLIWVDEEWYNGPEIQSLIEKGHVVDILPNEPNLILSTRAHWWHDKFWEPPTLLAMALKAARARKKGTKGGTKNSR